MEHSTKPSRLGRILAGAILFGVAVFSEGCYTCPPPHPSIINNQETENYFKSKGMYSESSNNQHKQYQTHR